MAQAAASRPIGLPRMPSFVVQSKSLSLIILRYRLGGSMLRVPSVLTIFALFLAGAVFAQTPPGDDAKRRLLEQKIKLLETLINSPAAKGAAYGREAESTVLVEKGKASVDAARAALAENRLDDAATLLDEALKSAATASRKLATDGGGLPDSALRKSLADLGEQVATYRRSIADLTRDAKSGAAAKVLLERVDGLGGESKRLAEDGRLGEANKKMAEAYKLAIEEISRLRAGQEVVLELKFDTPADEYAYEQKRYASNEIIVEMMIGEGRAAGGQRQLVDGFVGEGRRIKARAEGHAQEGQYGEAVAAMEKASTQLNRALQSMGVPVY